MGAGFRVGVGEVVEILGGRGGGISTEFAQELQKVSLRGMGGKLNPLPAKA